MCAINLDDNEKYSNTNVSKGTEKTQETSKNDDGESRNVQNRNLNFYECGKKICQLTYESLCTASEKTSNAIQGKFNKCMNITELFSVMYKYINNCDVLK